MSKGGNAGQAAPNKGVGNGCVVRTILESMGENVGEYREVIMTLFLNHYESGGIETDERRAVVAGVVRDLLDLLDLVDELEVK